MSTDRKWLVFLESLVCVGKSIWQSVSRTMREILYGMTVHEMHLELKKEQSQLNNLFLLDALRAGLPKLRTQTFPIPPEPIFIPFPPLQRLFTTPAHTPEKQMPWCPLGRRRPRECRPHPEPPHR